MKECTFRPNVRETSNSRLNNNSTLSARKNENSKTRSREIMPQTGNRFNDLY
jgi:hypothetical protein